VAWEVVGREAEVMPGTVVAKEAAKGAAAEEAAPEVTEVVSTPRPHRIRCRRNL